MPLSWLREDDTPMVELANRLGYESEAAFSRAFKRFIGVPPGAARNAEATGSSSARARQPASL